MSSSVRTPARLAALAALVLIPLLAACEVPAATFTVTAGGFDQPDENVGDGVCSTQFGPCTLRAAVEEGNANPNAGPIDVVLLANSHIMTLGDLDLTRPFRFVGTAGASSIVGVGADRLVDVHPGAKLTVTDAALGGGAAAVGGVINAVGADVVLTRVTLASGSATQAGGLVASDGGLVTVTDSRFDGGSAVVGGAILADRLVMVGSTVNASQAGEGAAIALADPAGASSIERSTLMGNEATAGSVVATAGGPLVVRDTAIVENRSTTGSLAGGTANQVANSILTVDTGPVCAAAVTSLGGNVGQGTTCGLTQATDAQGAVGLDNPIFVTAGLGLVPRFNSVLVVDAGTGCLPVDQLGAARPTDGDVDGIAECDRGPIESSLLPLTVRVRSTADAPDLSPGDGQCTTSVGLCTLRAAVQEANAWPTADEVILTSATTYPLTRAGAGEDAAATGDLDITGDVVIRPDAGTAIIDANDLDRVFDVRSGTVRVHDVVIRNGTETTGGGGIRTVAGTDVHLDRVTVYANLGAGGGGGIRAAGALTIERSLVRQNAAGSGRGGGIHVEATGSVVVANSTVFSNSAAGGSGIAAMKSSHLDVVESTIASNVSGPGLQASGTVTVRASILTGHVSGNCSGTLTSLGHNLDSGTTCALIGGGDVSSTDPLLGALANNGGFTLTLKPAAGSPAIGTSACVGVTDQRGVARPQGGACDKGSVEQ
jgi:CSLREA domain-containing protein